MILKQVLTTLGRGKLTVGVFCGYKSSTECSDKGDEFALTNDSWLKIVEMEEW